MIYYKCKLCGDILNTNTNHEMRSCTCGALSVDGGHDYVRVIGNEEEFEVVIAKKEQSSQEDQV